MSNLFENLQLMKESNDFFGKDDKTGIEYGINVDGDLYIGNEDSGSTMPDTPENRERILKDFKRYNSKNEKLNIKKESFSEKEIKECHKIIETEIKNIFDKIKYYYINNLNIRWSTPGSYYNSSNYELHVTFGRYPTEYPVIFGYTLENVQDEIKKLKVKLKTIGLINIKLSTQRKSRNEYSLLITDLDANIKYSKIIDKAHINIKDAEDKAEQDRLNFEDEISNVDLKKYKVTKSDFIKMINYYDRGSDPERLAKSIKSVDKLVARYAIAYLMDWEDAIYEFGKKAKEFDVTEAELEAYARNAKSQGLPEEYQKMIDERKSSGVGKFAAKSNNIKDLSKIIPKLHKILYDRHIPYKIENRTPNRYELEKDYKNGRCYTLAYTLIIYPNTNEEQKIDICKHTNEGGGTYGYSGAGTYYSSLNELINNILEKINESTNESLNEDFEVNTTEQEFTSANTSINSSKLPAIFKLINLPKDTINLDYGGGRFDNATKELEKKGVTNLIYDPYNRSSQHNKEVIEKIKENHGADSATCSNVLNVIKEENSRAIVIKNIYNLLKSGKPAYFTVYEGRGDGQEGATKSGYQLNRKTADYLDEIKKVFSNVKRKGKLIIAIK